MHFPEGKNDSADARRLFGDWRTSLLKKGTPGPRVLVTHGQSSTHWISDDQGRLCIDLDDMWGDFEHAAECRRLDQIAIAVALGHPIGASCSRILSTMIYELRRSGGGQGDAVLLEV